MIVVENLSGIYLIDTDYLAEFCSRYTGKTFYAVFKNSNLFESFRQANLLATVSNATLELAPTSISTLRTIGVLPPAGAAIAESSPADKMTQACNADR